MPEIYHFEIHKADAQVNNGKMTVRLFYPRTSRWIERRLPENLEFGIHVLEKLINEGYSPIADGNNPIKPASAGSVYLLNDGKVICERRERTAPTHALYHSAHAGFTQSREDMYTEKGLKETGLRESAEECLLVTQDKPPWLIVPKDSKDYVIESARRLGLELRPRFIDVETVDPTDRLEVYDENDSPIFVASAFLEFFYESQTSLNAMQIRRIPLSSEEVLPINAEGRMENGKYIHFNQESYIIPLANLKHRDFGDILETPLVLQTKIEKGIPILYTPEYTEPYLGPDRIKVTHPHVWGPDDLLVRVLDALGVDGYKNRWMDIELWKEITKREGKNLLPSSVLRRMM